MEKKLIRDLIKIGKKIYKLSLVIGEGGNISARCDDLVYIKKKGASMAAGKKSDYVAIDIYTGKSLRKNSEPSSEIHMHLACYKARKDVGAVIHTHPVFATALAAAGRRIKPLTYEALVNVKSDIAWIGFLAPGSRRLGKAVGQAVKKHNAVLLKNHGLLTVGRDLKEALLRTIVVERAAMTCVASRML